MLPSESEAVTTFAPSAISFSMQYSATFPEPLTAATLPFTLSPRVASICSMK